MHFELTPQEAEEWYRGRDVYPQAAPVADDVLVTFQHQPIGLAKRIGSRLKTAIRVNWCAMGNFYR